MLMPTVIGLDLSLTGSGIASTRGWCDRVGLTGVTRLPLTDRVTTVDQIANQVLLLARNADLAVVEQPAYTRALPGRLETSALWWLVVRALRYAEVPVAVVTPGQLKRYATGTGSATKSAVVDAVARRWPMYNTGGDDNLADAVVLAAMGADRLGCPIGTVPARQRAVLDRVAWPDTPTGATT